MRTKRHEDQYQPSRLHGRVGGIAEPLMTVLSQRHINRRPAVLLSNPREIEVRNASHLMHEDQLEEIVRVVVESVSAMS
jgi:hypothetical protein